MRVAGGATAAGIYCVALIVCLATLPRPAAASFSSRKLLQGWQVVVPPWFDTPSSTATSAASYSSDQSSNASSNTNTNSNTNGDDATSSTAAPTNNSGEALVTATTLDNDNGTVIAPVTECPSITIRMLSLEVYHSIIRDPNAIVGAQCKTKDRSFPRVAFSVSDYTDRGSNGARYLPMTPVGQLNCGEVLSCTIGAIPSYGPSAGVWRVLATEGCTFDYRHFTQLSYQQPQGHAAWTCSDPPVRYTLDCVECSRSDFPWDTALALAGPPLENETSNDNAASFNSIIIIVAVAVVSMGVLLVVLAMVIRSRRQASVDARMNEMVRRVRAERTDANANGGNGGGGAGRRSRNFKPAEIFEVGEAKSEPPPPDYCGPIVVLNFGEDSEDATTLPNWGFGGTTAEQQQQQQRGAGGNTTTSSNDSTSNSDSDIRRSFRTMPSIAIARPEVTVSSLAVDDGEDDKISQQQPSPSPPPPMLPPSTAPVSTTASSNS